jgi:hypothetical protein
LSVFARRRRCETRIEAGSTTWLSMPCAVSNRCGQKPSNPASWISSTPTGVPMLASAFPRSRANSASSDWPRSVADTVCRDIFSLPGSIAVTCHVDWLSSNEPRITASFAWVAVVQAGS